VSLIGPTDGVIASDTFRDQGFLIGADPGSVAVPGCADARSAAVVSQSYLTSSTADDPAKCNTLPLLIDFLADTPAGAVQVTPLTPGTATMEVVYRDLSRSTEPTLAVAANKAKARGGVDSVLIRATAGPVQVTTIAFSPVG
jgi:hypothetical protein